MSVVVSIEEVGPCRKQLTVEVPPPAVEAETARVIEGFSRRAKIPGFRKGKVPSHVIKSRFQKDIEHEVLERLIPRYWKQAQAESNLEPLLPPSIQDVDLEEDAGLRFTATVEIRPEIELRETREFDLPDMDTEPTAEEIERALSDLRKNATDWQGADRAAADGDRVNGYLTELGADGEPLGDPQTVAVQVGSEGLWPELTEVLTGMSARDSAEFERTEQGETGELTRRFRVAVEAVLEGTVPELDDELAKKLGDFDDVAALTAEVEERLRAGKREELGRERERAVLDQLRHRHPVPLPEGVLDQEVERILVDYAETLARQGVDVENAEIDWESLRDQVRPQAQKRVHGRLLLDAVGEAEQMEVTEEEFQGVLAAMAQAQGASPLALRRSLDESGRLGDLRAQLLRRKTLRMLLGELPEAEEPAEAEETQPAEPAEE